MQSYTETWRRLKAGRTRSCGTPSPGEDTLPRTQTHNREKSNDMLILLARLFAMFSSFERALTYSLALWRHVVCSWLAPLPPSASALSLAEVRKTVLMPDELRCLGWIFSLLLFAQKWSRNSSLFCTYYMPKNPQEDLEGWSAVKKTTAQMLRFPSWSKCALIKLISSWSREFTIEEDFWLPSIIIIIHILTRWSVWHTDIL